MRSGGNVLSGIVFPDRSIPQIVIGTPQTSDGAVTSASFAALSSNGPTLSVTPSRNGRWRISCNVPLSSATITASVGARIAATVGSPTLVFGQDAAFLQAVAASALSCEVYGIYDLVAGTAYTFRLEVKASLGAVTLGSSLLANGSAIIGQEFSA